MAAIAHAPRTYTIPKPSGGLRLMAVLEPPDAARWDALAREACDPIERHLGPEVLGNRWAATRGRPEPFHPALRCARTAARHLSSRSPTALRTDVRAFYPSVTPAVLADSLTRLGVERSAAANAAALMTQWEAHDVSGLPVGPPPSALFANAVLAPLDGALRAGHLPFLRWVDDYLIALRDQEPGAVLDVMDEELARLGLSRAPGKTSVRSGPVADWLSRDYTGPGRTIRA